MTTEMMKEENNELETLIAINKDACSFYSSAQEKAETPHMKTVFMELEKLHSSVVSTLSSCVRANGETADVDTTLTGKTTQFIGELASKISNDVDATMVKHLEEAEDRCLNSMRSAINSEDITPSTKNVLKMEMETLQKSHDYMRDLKENMAA